MKKKGTSEVILNSKVFGKFALVLVFTLLICFSSQSQDLQIPEIVSIFNDNDGRPILSWTKNTDDAVGYVTIRKEYSNDYVDTIYSVSDTTSIDTKVNACDKWYQYYVFAIADTNSSGGWSRSSEWSDGRKTLFLSNPDYDICKNENKISWTPFSKVTHPGEVEIHDHNYRVLISENNGVFNTLAETNSTELSFIHNNLAPNTSYTYKVQAVDTFGIVNSSSCEVSMLTSTYAKPTYANVLNVSVENNEYVKIDWEADQNAIITKYEITRSDGEIFEITDPTQNSFSDFTADFNSQSYDYNLAVFDQCDFEAQINSIKFGRTIFLQWQPGPENLQIQLSWNAYADWSGGVDSYNIYRKESGNFTQIKSIDGNKTSYTDPDVSGLTETDGIFTYYVEAVENGGNHSTSKSNQIVVELETKVLVPNAFIPEGLPPDNKFIPILSFVDKNSYELLVFNKWGQMLFSTTESDECWDGKFNGEYVPADAYVYRIRVKSPDGRDFTRQGTVTVIR